MIFKSTYPDVEIPDRPLTHYLLEKMAPFGDKAALIDGPTGRTITYNQLSGAIRLVASSLSKRGFGKGDVLAIYSPNLPEYAIAFHAVVYLGGVVTTLNPLYTPDEVAHQLNDAGAKYILTIPMFLENAQKAAEKANIEEIFVFGEADGATPFASLLKSDGQVPEVEFNPAEDLAVLPYSSGTTGLPKGVMLTHHNIVANMAQAEGLEDFELVNETDTVIGVLPFYHIYGMVVIMNMSLARGATIVTVPRFDPIQFLEIIQKHKITRMNLVPPILVFLAKHPVVDNYDLSSLIEMTSGAAPLGEELASAVAARLGCRVMQGYGMTETSPVATINPNPDDNIKYTSAGLLLPNMEIKIADVETEEELGVGEDGEVWMRGPNIMKGYLNNKGATESTLTEDGWLKSGDIGHMDEEGHLYIVDRLKELIKYKGFQVAPAELEALLLGNEAVADVAVIPKPDEEAGEIPKAYVVLKGELEADELMSWVAGQVAPHKKIRDVEFVSEIPKSASGKILRRVLVEQERERLSND
ncbi:MAG: 4-coumarate--CoA ligase family protein [Anaerolineales bacterium]|nr:4-coumarate--CoA ligase family protein [Anaerolineales bacterium]